MSDNLEKLAWPARDVLRESIYSARMASGRSLKNCYLAFGNVWQVKLFLGGAQRTLAHSHSAMNSMRFADMAILHFLPYRKRRNRPLVDADLNFTVEMAKSDLAERSDARAILERWERALLSRQVIQTVAQVFDHTVTPEKIRKQIGVTANRLFEDFETANRMLRDSPIAKVQLEMFYETLDKLRIQLRSLDALLFSLPVNNTETTPTNERHDIQTNQPMPPT
jgi:hypothetical protein